MTKTEIKLAWGLILLSMLACQNLFAPIPPSPTPQPMPSMDEMRFNDAETGRRFRTLDRCIRDIADDSWQTTSYRVLGNFYTSSWCRGLEARYNCQVLDSNIDQRDQRVIELNTLLYNQNNPEFFGLGFQSHWVPKSTGWGASYFFAEQGQGTVGEGWGVTFRQYVTPAGPPEAIVQLGSDYRYTIFGPQRTQFEYSSELPIREDLALYLSSPEAMRDRGLFHIQALAQKVSTAIHTHQVNTCDPGPYLGKGVPPACPTRPMTSSEEAEERTRAEAYFAEQEELLRDHYQEMYAAWMTAFPLDQCWP